jgi:hypothetical protein
MKLFLIERRSRSGWRDFIFSETPMRDRELQSVPVTSDGTTREHFYPGGFAQQQWEDDGGRPRCGPNVTPAVLLRRDVNPRRCQT